MAPARSQGSRGARVGTPLRLLTIASLLVWLVTAEMATAAPLPSPERPCPTRAEVNDAMRPEVMGNLWLVVSFGSVVGLTGATLGVPAAVAAAALGAGLAWVNGLAGVVEADQLIRDNLPDIADRLGRSSESLYDQWRYGEDLVLTSWMVRVTGAAVGSVVGLLVPLGIGSLQGLGASVVMGTAGGVVLGDFWHRWALWPFFDDETERCPSLTHNQST